MIVNIEPYSDCGAVTTLIHGRIGKQREERRRESGYGMEAKGTVKSKIGNAKLRAEGCARMPRRKEEEKDQKKRECGLPRKYILV